jgi:hypothetical protein
MRLKLVAVASAALAPVVDMLGDNELPSKGRRETKKHSVS